ncbi:hypothetical protein M8J77_014326 [Diaphorina citri]|nr:hypothetical protein M8J77_014326 [Diaphorina citri]
MEVSMLWIGEKQISAAQNNVSRPSRIHFVTQYPSPKRKRRIQGIRAFRKDEQRVLTNIEEHSILNPTNCKLNKGTTIRERQIQHNLP